jgi:hypothetical protein
MENNQNVSSETVYQMAERLYPVEMAMGVPSFHNIENWDINKDARDAFLNGFITAENIYNPNREPQI